MIDEHFANGGLRPRCLKMSKHNSNARRSNSKHCGCKRGKERNSRRNGGRSSSSRGSSGGSSSSGSGKQQQRSSSRQQERGGVLLSCDATLKQAFSTPI